LSRAATVASVGMWSMYRLEQKAVCKLNTYVSAFLGASLGCVQAQPSTMVQDISGEPSNLAPLYQLAGGRQPRAQPPTNIHPHDAVSASGPILSSSQSFYFCLAFLQSERIVWKLSTVQATPSCRRGRNSQFNARPILILRMSSQEVAVDSASPANDQAASVAANPAGAADVTHLTDEHEISDNGIEMTAALSHMPSTDIEATLFDDGADYSSIRYACNAAIASSHCSHSVLQCCWKGCSNLFIVARYATKPNHSRI